MDKNIKSIEIGGNNMCIYKDDKLLNSVDSKGNHEVLGKSAKSQPDLDNDLLPQRKGTAVIDVVPLTPAQVWFLNAQKYQPNRYALIRMFEVNRHFDPNRLQQVLNYLWKIHDALRARFIRCSDMWKQIIDGPEQSAPDFRVYNLTDVPVENEGLTIEKYMELLKKSINITQGPLMVTAYLNFGPNRLGRLIMIVHHFLVDAISISILIKDLQTAYRQLCEGHAIDLPKQGTSIKEWIELLYEYLLSDEHHKAIDYLLTLPWGKIPGLPLDFPQNLDQNFNYSTAKVIVSLTEEETIILTQKVTEVLNTKVENVLLWALTKVISEWIGSNLVEITVVGNGRKMIPDQKNLNLFRTVGYLVALRSLLLENIKYVDWSQEIAFFCKQVNSIPNSGYDYFLAASINNNNQIISKLQKIRSIEKYLNSGEIFINYRGSIFEKNKESSELKLVYQGGDGEPHDNRLRKINIVGDIANHCLNLVWEYSYNLYKLETIEKLAEKYINIIKDLVQKLTG
jgi:hypothetical protein